MITASERLIVGCIVRPSRESVNPRAACCGLVQYVCGTVLGHTDEHSGSVERIAWRNNVVEVR